MTPRRAACAPPSARLAATPPRRRRRRPARTRRHRRARPGRCRRWSRRTHHLGSNRGGTREGRRGPRRRRRRRRDARNPPRRATSSSREPPSRRIRFVSPLRFRALRHASTARQARQTRFPTFGLCTRRSRVSPRASPARGQVCRPRSTLGGRRDGRASPPRDAAEKKARRPSDRARRRSTTSFRSRFSFRPRLSRTPSRPPAPRPRKPRGPPSRKATPPATPPPPGTRQPRRLPARRRRAPGTRRTRREASRARVCTRFRSA